MKTVCPDYYESFKCIAGKCRHTCCAGWEVDIDGETLEKYKNNEEIESHIEYGDTPHFALTPDERCPFLREDNLCDLIVKYGEDSLCQICTDHPRFRNFWSDRTEIGLGLVCEEAARLILSRESRLSLKVLSDDGEVCEVDEEEKELMQYRDALLDGITETGAAARLLEYLIYRHIPDALYDGRTEERYDFIRREFGFLKEEWKKTDGSLEALLEIVRIWSYDVEYDEEELERRISGSLPQKG